MTLRRLARWLMAGAMVAIGITHFTAPKPYIRIVPAALPAPAALVYISGFFEILGGLGLLIPRLRRPAAWGLVALYVAVFPANINMALKNEPLAGKQRPLLLWLRLPLQPALIAMALWVGKPDGDGE
jgi:uncharacterized membrane protein